jgi:hypothetical protein
MGDGPPRTDEEVRGFLTRWVGGANAGDWDAVAALMDVDIVYADPMAPTPARGRTAAITRAQQQYAPFPDGLVTMVGAPFVSLDEPEIAYHWRFRGTHLHRVDPPGFAPTGHRSWSRAPRSCGSPGPGSSPTRCSSTPPRSRDSCSPPHRPAARSSV